METTNMRELHQHEVWALMARAEERYRARLASEKTIFTKNNLTAWFTDDTTVSPAQMGTQPNANTMNPKLNLLLVSLAALLAAGAEFIQSKIGTAPADTPKPKEPEAPPAGKKSKATAPAPAPTPAPAPATEPITLEDDDDDEGITLGGEAVNYPELRAKIKTFLAPKLKDKEWRNNVLTPALTKANISQPVQFDAIPDENLPALAGALGVS